MLKTNSGTLLIRCYNQYVYMAIICGRTATLGAGTDCDHMVVIVVGGKDINLLRLFRLACQCLRVRVFYGFFVLLGGRAGGRWITLL